VVGVVLCEPLLPVVPVDALVPGVPAVPPCSVAAPATTAGSFAAVVALSAVPPPPPPHAASVRDKISMDGYAMRFKSLLLNYGLAIICGSAILLANNPGKNERSVARRLSHLSSLLFSGRKE
jgi:hypothetical protein